MISALRRDGPCASMLLDGPMDGESFRAYVEQTLLPALRPDDGVVMDNLSTHKTLAVEAAFARQGIRVLYLPPYSPDLNPIENLWSDVKALMRKHATRTLHGLMYAMAEAMDAVTPCDGQGYFKNAEYDFHEIS